MPPVYPDHFSATAAAYARFRPHYPDALFDWLGTISPTGDRAWDCATGSGQAAAPLARRFRMVIASDASRHQLASADAPMMQRVASLAEVAPIRSSSLDLVTVAQALHWLDVHRFFAEVARCLVPGGVLAAWTYSLCQIEPEIDVILREFYEHTLAGCWPPERRMVENGYATLDFPFSPIASPVFAMSAEWNLDALLGYVGTWSAVRQYRARRDADPMPGLRDRLLSCWSSADRVRQIRWPLSLRAGRADGRRPGR
ncbi:MAG: class I SAM-dependent methyltransferase [Gemmatimonadota bacterium]|nr:class I SAM-dependent methyltransferase [Gemmatimonadota bacterium]